MIGDIIKDILKCAKVALLVAAIVSVLFGIIYYLFYRGGSIPVLQFLKDRLYNAGCLGFLISAGFFMQRDATRPLDYHKQWKRMFRRFNLGIVIMTVSFFVCFYGMIIQLFIERYA